MLRAERQCTPYVWWSRFIYVSDGPTSKVSYSWSFVLFWSTSTYHVALIMREYRTLRFSRVHIRYLPILMVYTTLGPIGKIPIKIRHLVSWPIRVGNTIRAGEYLIYTCLFPTHLVFTAARRNYVKRGTYTVGASASIPRRKMLRPLGAGKVKCIIRTWLNIFFCLDCAIPIYTVRKMDVVPHELPPQWMRARSQSVVLPHVEIV